ncbi:MAG TPA: S41 family peptidase [Chitinophagaceae bacterium]|nr:S41 family peptidase [Chitinophagaceae bacterium]
MKRLQVWLPLLFALVMIVGMIIGFRLRKNIRSDSNFFGFSKETPLQEVLDIINRNYVDAVNTDTLGNDAIQEMLTHLDPHSVYIPASILKEVNEDLEGNFQGIGVEFQIIKDTVHVVNVLPKGPSDEAGLKIGDRFLQVEDSVVAGTNITTEKIKKLLRGPGGSKVNVKMLRGKQVQPFTIKRGTIPIPSLDASYMIDPSTGYIRLNKFAETTYEEFMAALEALQKQRLQQLILDLRGNGGGILQEAVQIADEFLDGSKLIVYTQGNKTDKEVYESKREGLFEKGKLVILIDEGSASASEVVAGAVQDWDRGTIIGRRSFGKGLVQQQYELSDGSGLRLTVSRYYTPLGRSIQKPYSKSIEEYNDEVIDRFVNGEVLKSDSAKIANGQVYTTKGGRKVYGGGGIAPDVFVAFDTSFMQKSIADLYNDNAVFIFPYIYYVEHQQELKQYKDPADFARRFNNWEELWNGLLKLAKNDSLNLGNVNAAEKQYLLYRLRANIARQIWRTEGFYEVWNTTDPVVQRALAELKK